MDLENIGIVMDQRVIWLPHEVWLHVVLPWDN